MMKDDIKHNLQSSDTWMRILYIFLFILFYSLAEVLLSAVVAFQLLLVLFTGSKNERLLKLGQGLSTYIYQVLSFMTFNSDYKPYPFGAWPQGEPKSGAAKAKAVSKQNNKSAEAEKDADD